jgi:p-cumate 2,3-dioxygenase beta subunit
MTLVQGLLPVTRQEAEDFLYHEAELLDSWRLEEWLGLLTEDAHYLVPPNEKPEGDSKHDLFIIADDITRIRARVKRLLSPDAHAEWPHSHTRRMITNVMVSEPEGAEVLVRANFIVHRFRRGREARVYVGRTHYRLRRDENGALKIAERRVVLDDEALGSLGAVTFIL